MPIRHFPNFPPTLFKREKRAVKSIRNHQPRTSNTTLPEGPETNWNTDRPKPTRNPTIQSLRIHIISTLRTLHNNTLTSNAFREHLNSARTRTIPMSNRIHPHRSSKLLKTQKDRVIAPATILLQT